jgi:superfamily II DNA/RNA helicase
MNLANADIVTLTEVQKAAIPPAIEGLDVIAKSHTGMCSVMMICDVVTCV